MLLALLLAAAPAASNAIIWTGTNDPVSAREQLEGWPKDEATWSRRVKLAEGYPRLYGLLDMFGNAAEWVDGAVVTVDNVKRFPTRGEAATSKDFALWLSASAPIDAQRGFRCARACVWKPGVELPKLPDPIDLAPASDPAHQAIADPARREALELWRAARVKELGEGATVEWRELTATSWNLVTNYVRERVGAQCLEGPIGFTIVGARQVTPSPRWVGAIACCSEKCGPPSPAEAVLRFLEDADLGAISCKPFDASGVSECDISNSRVTVKQRKKDTVITRVSQHISEGC